MDYYSIYVPINVEKGFAYVRDFKGNLIFYGTLEQCYDFIERMMDDA